MNTITYIIIDIVIFVLASISIVTTIVILISMIYNRQQHPLNTTTLIACNTYIATIISCVMMIIMFIPNLLGNMYQNYTFNNRACYSIGYIINVGIESVFFSFLLQAIFRVFRIVLYKYVKLQTFRFTFQIILIQWIFAFISLVPLLAQNHYSYLPELYFCQVPFTDRLGTVYVSLIIYSLPTLMTGFVYVFIMFHIRQTSVLASQRNRQRSNLRDIVVLRRIIILLGIIVVLTLPSTILWVYYLFSNYLHPLIYHIVWLILATSFSILPLALASLSPQTDQIFNFLKRNARRIQPIVRINHHQQNQATPNP